MLWPKERFTLSKSSSSRRIELNGPLWVGVVRPELAESLPREELLLSGVYLRVRPEDAESFSSCPTVKEPDGSRRLDLSTLVSLPPAKYMLSYKTWEKLYTVKTPGLSPHTPRAYKAFTLKSFYQSGPLERYLRPFRRRERERGPLDKLCCLFREALCNFQIEWTFSETNFRDFEHLMSKSGIRRGKGWNMKTDYE